MAEVILVYFKRKTPITVYIMASGQALLFPKLRPFRVL
jgi:hypothetical protein